MSRQNLLLYATCVSLLLVSTSAASQDTAPLSLGRNMQIGHPGGSAPDSGQYDHRALRFESHRGTIRILQGNDDVVVGKTHWFRRFDLASIVSSSDRALAEAQEFNKARTPGMWALSLGILAVAADGILVQAKGSPSLVTSGLGIGGVLLIVSGAERLDRASEALSKSLWWYNRDLKK